jgi:cytochrome c oxidase assembly protein subunit 15
MSADSKTSAFTRFAWTALVFNIVVILWGVFLRASKSGDGCGQHWLTCHGEVIPSAPELKTVIEFSHRLTSGIAFLVVLALLVWAFRSFGKGSAVRKLAAGAFIFIFTEALVGAGLVLTGNTAEAVTSARPFWAIGHLINTFILLGFLSLTAWVSRGERRLDLKSIPTKYLVLIAVGVLGIVFVGASGSVAALSSMLFPSSSLAEGISKDFSEASNVLLRLRVSHPILSILTGVYLWALTLWLTSASGDGQVERWSKRLRILVLCQLAFGAATLLTLAPILMQIGHLLLADLVWISFVLMSANFVTTPQSEPPA